jgi:hypothetical protein
MVLKRRDAESFNGPLRLCLLKYPLPEHYSRRAEAKPGNERSIISSFAVSEMRK